MSDAAIVAAGLTRTFGKLTAVDAVDLTIPKAKIYGFLGPNGSGKTTTIRMLCGLLKPSAGSAHVFGMELPRDAEKVRPRIGYMTQKFSLYEDLTVRENLEFMGRIYSMHRRRRRERIESNLARYALEPCGADCVVEQVNANLEDVFVAATGFDGDAALPATGRAAAAVGPGVDEPAGDEPGAGSDEVAP